MKLIFNWALYYIGISFFSGLVLFLNNGMTPRALLFSGMIIGVVCTYAFCVINFNQRVIKPVEARIETLIQTVEQYQKESKR